MVSVVKVLKRTLGVVEVIFVRRLKWLVAFVVKRSGVGCCRDF